MTKIIGKRPEKRCECGATAYPGKETCASCAYADGEAWATEVAGAEQRADRGVKSMGPAQITRMLNDAGFMITLQERGNDYSITPQDPNRLTEMEQFLRRELPSREVNRASTRVYVSMKSLPDTETRVKALRQRYGSKATSSNNQQIRKGDLVSWRDSGPEGSGRWLQGNVTGVDSVTVEIETPDGGVYMVEPRQVSVSARETNGSGFRR